MVVCIDLVSSDVGLDQASNLVGVMPSTPLFYFFLQKYLVHQVYKTAHSQTSVWLEKTCC